MRATMVTPSQARPDAPHPRRSQRGQRERRLRLLLWTAASVGTLASLRACAAAPSAPLPGGPGCGGGSSIHARSKGKHSGSNGASSSGPVDTPLGRVSALYTFPAAPGSAPAFAPAQGGQGVGVSSPPVDGGFLGYSLDPAFYNDYFGRVDAPNNFTFDAFAHITRRVAAGASASGSAPNTVLRCGGDTSDSSIFSASAALGPPVTSNGSAAADGLIPTAERLVGPSGIVWRTTFGPGYYESWARNFPDNWRFTVPLDFKNRSLTDAADMAAAAVKYVGPQRIESFALGNEPNLYPKSLRFNSTSDYVHTWLEWTAAIDAAVNGALPPGSTDLPAQRWEAASNVALVQAPPLDPSDLLRAGLRAGEGGPLREYSIHGYQYNSCNAQDAARATIANLLDFDALRTWARQRIDGSLPDIARSGGRWILGESNSVACEGKVGVSDTFAQALYLVAHALTWAQLGAARVQIHNGATLLNRANASEQVNQQADLGGAPSYSSYSLLYPRDTPARGPQRTNPGYLSQLFLAEALAGSSRVVSLPLPKALATQNIVAVGLYDASNSSSNGGAAAGPSRVVLVDGTPYLSASGQGHPPITNFFDLAALFPPNVSSVSVKRLTAPAADTTDAAQTTWAGQSFRDAQPSGTEVVEALALDTAAGTAKLALRNSEAVLVFLQGPPPFVQDNAGVGSAQGADQQSAGSDDGDGADGSTQSATVAAANASQPEAGTDASGANRPATSLPANAVSAGRALPAPHAHAAAAGVATAVLAAALASVLL